MRQLTGFPTGPLAAYAYQKEVSLVLADKQQASILVALCEGCQQPIQRPRQQRLQTSVYPAGTFKGPAASMGYAGDVDTACIDSECLQGVPRMIRAAPPFGPMFIVASFGSINPAGYRRTVVAVTPLATSRDAGTTSNLPIGHFMRWVGFNGKPKVPSWIFHLYAEATDEWRIAAQLDRPTYDAPTLGVTLAEHDLPEVTVTATRATDRSLFINFVNRSLSKAHQDWRRVQNGFGVSVGEVRSVSAPEPTAQNDADIPWNGRCGRSTGLTPPPFRTTPWHCRHFSLLYVHSTICPCTAMIAPRRQSFDLVMWPEKAGPATAKIRSP